MDFQDMGMNKNFTMKLLMHHPQTMQDDPKWKSGLHFGLGANNKSLNVNGPLEPLKDSTDNILFFKAKQVYSITNDLAIHEK